MIQRIQTLYLIIAFIASVLLFFFPIHNYTIGIMDIITTVIMVIVPGLILASIFLYKNRVLQMRILAIAFLVKAIYIALNYFEFSDKEIITLSSLFSFIILAMIFIANKAIKSDEEKLKKSNRIR
mgnify:CR=1 FL=1